MLLRTWKFYLSETFSNLRRNAHTTYITVGITLVCLLVLGISLVFVININRLVADFLNNLQIMVFLDEDLDSDRTIELLHQIRDEMEGIRNIEYLSKEDAMRWMKNEAGYAVEDYTDRNPLPASFRIILKAPKYSEEVADKISALEGIEEVRYPKEDLNRYVLPGLYFWLAVCFVIALILAGATVFIISYTIRLAIYARRKEIKIMRLVGATDWAVRGPFLFEGLIYGFVGGISAALLVSLGYSLIFNGFNEMVQFRPVMVSPGIIFYNLTLLMVTLGLVVGAAGSLISVDKFLEEEYIESSQEITTHPDG